MLDLDTRVLNVSNIKRELDALAPECTITTHETCSVYLAQGIEIPHIMDQINLLRIRVFAIEHRTNMLDEFDPYYFQLFVMNNETYDILGAYRLGFTDKIIEKYGVEGLYISTLHTLSEDFFHKTGSLIELGQAFISPDNKGSAPVLPLLLKGLMLVVLCNKYSGMYGLNSIMNTYTPESKALIVHCLRTYCGDSALSSLATPKHPYQQPIINQQLMDELIVDKDWVLSLDKMIRTMEKNQRGLPMFLKFHLKLNPTFISVGWDPHFDNSLDCFMLGLVKNFPEIQLIK
jgi:hypothetical protein